MPLEMSHQQERQEDELNRTWCNSEEAKPLNFTYQPRTNELKKTCAQENPMCHG